MVTYVLSSSKNDVKEVGQEAHRNRGIGGIAEALNRDGCELNDAKTLVILLTTL